MNIRLVFRFLACFIILASCFPAFAQRRSAAAKSPLVAALLKPETRAGNQRISGPNSVPGNSQDFANQNGQWVQAYASSYTYNPAGKLLTRLFSHPATNMPEKRDVYVYDNSNNLIEMRAEVFNGISWDTVSGQKAILTYNAANKVGQIEVQVWQNGWEKYDLIHLTYTPSSLIESETWSEWHGNWVPATKIIYSYQALLINQVLTQQYDNQSGLWYNEERKINVVWHTPNRDVSAYLQQLYVNGQWQDNGRYTATYHPTNGSYVAIYEARKNGIWENAFRYFYTCDNKKNYIGSESEKWMSGAWFFEWEEQEVLTYNNNDITERIYRDTHSSTGMLEDRFKEVYSNFINLNVSAVSDLAPKTDFRLFPNPATQTVSISLPEQTLATVILSDVTGREILRDILPAGAKSLNLENLKNGLYLVRVETEKQTFSTKLIKK